MSFDSNRLLVRGVNNRMEWVSGFYVPGSGLNYGDSVVRDWIYIVDEHGPIDSLAVNRATVCQFSGRMDRDGRKLFEGDIVESTAYPSLSDDGERNYYGIVTWLLGFDWSIVACKAKGAKVRGISDGEVYSLVDVYEGEENVSSDRLRVVGNIFDNFDFGPGAESLRPIRCVGLSDLFADVDKARQIWVESRPSPTVEG